MNTAVDMVSLTAPVKRFLSQARQALIDGRWQDAQSGETFEVFNPSNESVIARVADCKQADVDLAVAAARKAFDRGPWPRMSPSARGRILWKIGDLILENLEGAPQLESLNNGKPIAVARAADVPLAADLFHYMAGWATKIEGNTINISVPYMPGANVHSYTLREPVGVGGQIIPWNFPLLMAAWKLGPALTTGNTIVLKPAEQTPLSALRLAELIAEAGLPDGVVNGVTGYGETAGAALAAHDDVDKVAFTGSTEVGKLILQAAAGNLKKLTLELGGKSPNIVFDDADVDSAIPGAASAIFFNQGQTCCAGSRLFIQKDIFDKVVEGISEKASKIRVRQGFDPDCDMGPLVSEEQLNRVVGYMDSGKKEGARATVGGSREGTKGYFVKPTVLVDTTDKMKVVREEIFGPVVTASPFNSIDEIAAKANDTVYGLAAGIWTKDIKKAHALAAKIKAGTVWINCYNVFDANMPFGGYKQSGWGREMGHEVLKNYTEVKSVCAAL